MRAHPTDAKAKHKQFGSTTAGHGKQALPQTPALKPYFHDDPQEKVAFHGIITHPSQACARCHLPARYFACLAAPVSPHTPLPFYFAAVACRCKRAQTSSQRMALVDERCRGRIRRPGIVHIVPPPIFERGTPHPPAHRYHPCPTRRRRPHDLLPPNRRTTMQRARRAVSRLRWTSAPTTRMRAGKTAATTLRRIRRRPDTQAGGRNRTKRHCPGSIGRGLASLSACFGHAMVMVTSWPRCSLDSTSSGE